MTFDLDIWPLTSSTNEGSHVASMTQLLVEIHPSMWKVEPNVNPFFTTDNNNRGCVFPAKAGDAKIGNSHFFYKFFKIPILLLFFNNFLEFPFLMSKLEPGDSQIFNLKYVCLLQRGASKFWNNPLCAHDLNVVLIRRAGIPMMSFAQDCTEINLNILHVSLNAFQQG